VDNLSWFSRFLDLFRIWKKKGYGFVLHDYLELAKKFGTLVMQLEPKFSDFLTILKSDISFPFKSGPKQL